MITTCPKMAAEKYIKRYNAVFSQTGLSLSKDIWVILNKEQRHKHVTKSG
jgi:hypothetical protein